MKTRRIGNFELLDLVAEGGMGVLRLARQPELDRLVVLKRMRRRLAGDPSMVARFEREARAAAAVQHQHVVAVYDCFRHRGDHYIAQEYVDGIDVADLLQRTGRIDPTIAARIALAVARGLEEVHSRGIVHRDLKPSNVLIGYGGDVKIADFGIAVERSGPGLTTPGTMLGSVPYMSPEQMMGEQVDYRSDLFSLGLLLYEMITGVPPFRESEAGSPDTLLERMQRGRFESPKRHGVEVPWWMRRLIRRCLRPKAKHRPQTVTQIRRTLGRRVRAVAPEVSRRAIAAWLAANGIARSSDSDTRLRPAVAVPPARRVPVPVWSASAAAAGLIVALAAAYAWHDGAPDPELLGNAAAARPAVTSSAVGTAAPWLGPAPEFSVVDPQRLPETGPVEDPPVELPPAPVSIRPAELRVIVSPWARVTVDGEETFLTPRAAPLELPPGTHRIRLEHPDYAAHVVEIELEAGQMLTLRHVFKAAS